MCTKESDYTVLGTSQLRFADGRRNYDHGSSLSPISPLSLSDDDERIENRRARHRHWRKKLTWTGAARFTPHSCDLCLVPPSLNFLPGLPITLLYGLDVWFPWRVANTGCEGTSSRQNRGCTPPLQAPPIQQRALELPNLGSRMGHADLVGNLVFP